GRCRARIARFELAGERDGDLDLPVAFAPRLRRAPAAGPVVAGRAHVDRPRVTGGAAEVGDAPRVYVVASGGLDLEQRLRIVLGLLAEIVAVIGHEAERTGGRGGQVRNRFLVFGRLIEPLGPVQVHLPMQGQGRVARGPSFFGAIIRGEGRRCEIEIAFDQVPDLPRLRIADLRGRGARRHRGND